MIAIKGMTKPKNCLECYFCSGQCCYFTGQDFQFTFDNGCPIMEVKTIRCETAISPDDVTKYGEECVLNYHKEQRHRMLADAFSNKEFSNRFLMTDEWLMDNGNLNISTLINVVEINKEENE